MNKKNSFFSCIVVSKFEIRQLWRIIIWEIVNTSSSSTGRLFISHFYSLIKVCLYSREEEEEPKRTILTKQKFIIIYYTVEIKFNHIIKKRTKKI